MVNERKEREREAYAQNRKARASNPSEHTTSRSPPAQAQGGRGWISKTPTCARTKTLGRFFDTFSALGRASVTATAGSPPSHPGLQNHPQVDVRMFVKSNQRLSRSGRTCPAGSAAGPTARPSPPPRRRRRLTPLPRPGWLAAASVPERHTPDTHSE